MATKCIEAEGPRNCDGYVRLSAYRFWRRFTFAHQIALIDHLGRLPRPGHQANHHCDNPPCISTRKGHLYEGTQQENIAERHARGRDRTFTDAQRVVVGRTLHTPEAHQRRLEVVRSRSKLSAEIVADIRRRYEAGGIFQSALADEYGVSQTMISHIVLGKTLVLT